MKQTIVLGALVFLSGCAATSNSSVPNAGNVTTTFQTPSALQISAAQGIGTPTKLLVGNFNGDAYPDIVLLTSLGAYLYINNSGSSWQSPVQIAPTASSAYTVGLAEDLDHDSKGNLDLILFYQAHWLGIFQNDGAGGASSFTLLSQNLPRPSDTLTSIAYAPAKDGTKSGIILGAASSGNHFWTTQTGIPSISFGGGAQNPSVSVSPEVGVKALAGKIDSGDYVDFALVPKSSGVPIQFLENSLDSSLTVSSTLTRTHSTTIYDSLLVDLDSDSKTDLLLATSTGLELYKGSGSFSGFTENTSFSVGVVASQMLVADFTGDGRQDLFLVKSSGAPVLYTQTGSLAFSDITSTAFGSTLTSGTTGAYAADIDNSTYQDIIELKSDGSIAVHTNNLTK